MLCVLCGVSEGYNEHHLTPASKGGKVKVMFCKECHDTVHATLTNKELERGYDTVESLLTQPEIARWVAWRKRHPNVAVKAKWTQGRHRRSRSKFS